MVPDEPSSLPRSSSSSLGSIYDFMHRNSAMEDDVPDEEAQPSASAAIPSTSVAQPMPVAPSTASTPPGGPLSIADIQRATGVLLLERLVSDLDPGSAARGILELRSSSLDVVR